ncbi:Tn3 family transposase, partial [Xenorhabdus sp. ZM]|uniref:Tn3 family transposase n=1 Tax=Xenorhabdus szentirmaii TaxID=290112 RepID=UPI0019C8F52B|nr:Tn3 family transposase [Xenorhabdus sp. ZM]
LRQNVQKSLNRGESYHKLRRSVSYANFGKLRFKTEQDQHIWNECSRLLKQLYYLLQCKYIIKYIKEITKSRYWDEYIKVYLT